MARKISSITYGIIIAGDHRRAAVDIVSMIKKRRKILNDISGKVYGQRKAIAPRSFSEIKIHYEINSPISQIEAGK